MRSRRLASSVVIIVSCALVVGGCAPQDDGRGAGTVTSGTEMTAIPGTPAQSATAVAGGYLPAACPNPIMAGLPQLDLGADFECGYLTVPENRSAQDGRTIRLAVAAARATAPARLPDAIVYLTGGPGNSALASAAGLVEAGWNAERDLVVLEQRGTLKSEPLLACPELDTYLDGAVGSPPTSSDVAAQEAEALQACRDRIAAEGWDLAAYNTTENAADVADLRVALGIEEWNVYGVSYGTYVALELLRNQPEGIRAVVLDSSCRRRPT